MTSNPRSSSLIHLSRGLILGLAVAMGATGCASDEDADRQARTEQMDVDLENSGQPDGYDPEFFDGPVFDFPPIDLCGQKADLAVSTPQVEYLWDDGNSTRGYARVRFRVENRGGQTSGAATLSMSAYISGDHRQVSLGSSNVPALGSGSSVTVTRYHFIGYSNTEASYSAWDEGQSLSYGQCRGGEVTYRGTLYLDPDLDIDGDPTNDECITSNNEAGAIQPYLLTCPW